MSDYKVSIITSLVYVLARISVEESAFYVAELEPELSYDVELSSSEAN